MFVPVEWFLTNSLANLKIDNLAIHIKHEVIFPGSEWGLGFSIAPMILLLNILY